MPILPKFLILAIFYGLKIMFRLKTDALALMAAASFFWLLPARKRYSGQQDTSVSD
jgi:hypothetical protein